MDFAAQIMSRRDQRRLDFLSALATIPDEQPTIARVATATAMTEEAVRTLVAGLNQQAQALGLELRLPMDRTTIHTQQVVLLKDELTHHLLAASIPARWCVFLLHHPEAPLTTFCHQMQISRATFFRRIRPLTQLAKTYQLQLKFDVTGITGDELRIRLFLWAVMWTVYRDSPTPVRSHIQAHVDAMLATFEPDGTTLKDPIAIAQSKMTLAICVSRILSGHGLTDPQRLALLCDDNAAARMPTMQALLRSRLALGDQMTLAEIEFMFFMSYFVPLFQSDQSRGLLALVGHFAKANNAVWQATTQFLAYLQHQILRDQMNPQLQQALVGNLCIAHLATLVLGPHYPSMMDWRPEKPVRFSQLKQEIDRYFATETLAPGIQANATQLSRFYYLQTMDLYWQIRQPDQLRVAFVGEASQLLTLNLKVLMANLQSVQLVPFSPDHPDRMDAVVTTSLQLANSFQATPVIWVPADGDPDRLAQVYPRLLALIERPVNPTD